MAADDALPRLQIRQATRDAVRKAAVWDLHTHLYPPSFGTRLGKGLPVDPDGLMLWGIDELLTYHYLVAELFRATRPGELTPAGFWSLSKAQHADFVWRRLFVEATPLSEACRGVVTTLTCLGLDPHEPTLDGYRKWFSERTPAEQIDRVLELAGVERLTMTNDPFDENERRRWLADPHIAADSRFRAVLRLDPLVVAWNDAAKQLGEWGYQADSVPSNRGLDEVKRFLDDWIKRMRPAYCAMSLPPGWRYPVAKGAEVVAGLRVLNKALLPVCAEHGLPLALMIGVTRGSNPELRDAGDTVGHSDVASVAALCREFPEQPFLVTMLARENQHELAVAARKFRNLTPFGCWWFLNTPSLIEEITRMRLELLGPSFIPQHSDARVLEHLIYKWDHSRAVIADALAAQHEQLCDAGYRVTRATVQADAERLLRGAVAAAIGKE